ncbi:MAG: hypothetical protein JXR07_11700 [Reichenbachiella sp.]
MKKRNNVLCFLFLLILVCSCAPDYQKGSFGFDHAFLIEHLNPVILQEDGGKSQLIISPEYQGRVMTSTATGLAGNSYGWINYELIAAQKFEEHINVFGGEDRFWIGPEGGQHSIFFKRGSDYTFENWFTPKEIDTEAFEVVSKSDKSVAFTKKMSLVNYQEYQFDIEVHREVSIFSKNEIESDLGIEIVDAIDFVGYQSDNEIINAGQKAWTKESGLLSIWILGMYMPSPRTTVILPYVDSLALNTSYFGTVPPGRLKITDEHVMYKGDGTARFKLGLPPKNVSPFIGSYDANNQMLTIVGYAFKGDISYVSSEWRYHKNPYTGDVVNSYNDGPLENGDQLGPFYELESSSSAKELAPGESIRHWHKTYHFEGDFEDLNAISMKLLGKNLRELK